ncbi:hypothetical protein [Microcoleus sp. FACHB-1515]|uniref:hypothetical protein n=1 Tax=Cyanophyceae TaxID=3028117 RepID=UPI001683A2E9|nr:hypothetical protein [Microcoleus sp. FACHB-1515]
MISQARSSSLTGAAVLIAVTVIAAAVPSYFNLKTHSPAEQQAIQLASQLMTLSEFEQIHPGLTIAQVSLLLGRSGEEISRAEVPEAPATALYLWQNPDGSRITVTFENGAVVAKSQSGLR